MVRFSWRSDLAQAASSDELVALARRFLAEWNPMEIALLPPGAWPDGAPRNVDELVEIALRIEPLLSAYGETGGPSGLREMLSFFTQVSIRALQLELGAHPHRDRRTD